MTFFFYSYWSSEAEGWVGGWIHKTSWNTFYGGQRSSDHCHGLRGSRWAMFKSFLLETLPGRCTTWLSHTHHVDRCAGLSGQQAAGRASLRAAGTKTESAKPFKQSPWRTSTSVSSRSGATLFYLFIYYTFKLLKCGCCKIVLIQIRKNMLIPAAKAECFQLSRIVLHDLVYTLSVSNINSLIGCAESAF